MPGGDAPLAGVLVADFSRVLAGPLATMTLADLGATVVKVERPGAGDETRSWGPPWTERASSYFECLNRSKLGITLDLDDAADLRRARELAARADVMVQNFRPGGLVRYGLDAETVRAANPSLVYCSISGFGDEAGRERPGYDFLVQAVGGLMSVTGEAGGGPTKVGVPIVDVLTGKDAVIGILAALRARESTGVGDHVRVALLGSALGGLVNQAAGFLATGVVPGRLGNAHPSIAPYETLRCADSPLAVACGNDAQFARLTAVLGVPALAVDPRFATNGQRVVNRALLVPLLEARLATDTAGAWEARLAAVGVPAGLVGDVASALERAAAYGLEPLVEIGGGHPPQVAHPVRYESARPAAATAPPALGEHNDVVAAWLDGPADVSAPRASGTGR